MFIILCTCVVILAGIAQDTFADITFTPITSSEGITYCLSDAEGDYSDAVTECSNAGMVLATFENNNQFIALMAALDSDGDYDDDQFWVEITTSGSQALGTDRYFFGNDEIAAGAWYSTEPDYSCTACCYRIKNPSEGSWFAPAAARGLADNGCDAQYLYICLGAIASCTPITASSTTVVATTIESTTITTTTIDSTTSVADTTSVMIDASTTIDTTTIETTTTIAEDISSTTATLAMTTATSFTTIIPITTTTTTSIPTTSIEDTLTTTATTASTTDIITTTTTFAVAATSTTSAVEMSTITAVAVTEENPVSLTMGQQMTVVMLGLILGPAFGITCICAGFWLFINRRCRRKKRPSEEKKEDIKEEDDDSSSDSD